MNWRYFIPHIWERERKVWEDVYLLPVDDRYEGEAIWLTIDALGEPVNPEDDPDGAESQAEDLSKLGDQDFHIDTSDMIVRATNFTKAELLEWVRVWLRENNLPVTDLIEGTAQDFKGKAEMADLILTLKEKGLD